MNFTIEEKEGVLWLEPHEELTIQHVVELKESLSHAAKSGFPLQVQASRLKKTHAAIVQLFLAWEKSGRKLSFVNPSVEFRKFMERLGVRK